MLPSRQASVWWVGGWVGVGCVGAPYWLRYLPANMVLYPSDCRLVAMVRFSLLLTQSDPAQLPSTLLLWAPWLWMYLPAPTPHPPNGDGNASANLSHDRTVLPQSTRSDDARRLARRNRSQTNTRAGVGRLKQ